jgi:hypothetical protein
MLIDLHNRHPHFSGLAFFHPIVLQTYAYMKRTMSEYIPWEWKKPRPWQSDGPVGKDMIA